MIISTDQELKLHVPSNAIDEIANLQGVLDNSEKDFLKDKLGTSLYNRLCEYYKSIDADDFSSDIINGTYVGKPWEELLLNAQRMVANDAMARFAYQQLISVNGAGVNIASSNDYDSASEKLLDKGIAGFRKEAMVSLNNTLLLLEGWAKDVNTPALIDTDTDTEDTNNTEETDEHKNIEEIVLLWQESNYYYLHHDLLIPSCTVLQQYIDIYDNRDKFIRLIPDIRFIQEEYIEESFGEDFINNLLQADDRDRMLKKVRRLIVAHLEDRTTVLNIDKSRRSQAHDEAISLRSSILRMIKEKENSNQENVENNNSSTQEQNEGYQNNQDDSRMFVSPLLF